MCALCSAPFPPPVPQAAAAPTLVPVPARAASTQTKARSKAKRVVPPTPAPLDEGASDSSMDSSESVEFLSPAASAPARAPLSAAAPSASAPAQQSRFGLAHRLVTPFTSSELESPEKWMLALGMRMAAGNISEFGNPRDFPSAHLGTIIGRVGLGAFDFVFDLFATSNRWPYVAACLSGWISWWNSRALLTSLSSESPSHSAESLLADWRHKGDESIARWLLLLATPVKDDKPERPAEKTKAAATPMFCVWCNTAGHTPDKKFCARIRNLQPPADSSSLFPVFMAATKAQGKPPATPAPPASST